MRNRHTHTIALACPLCDHARAHVIPVYLDGEMPLFEVPTRCSKCNTDYSDQEQWDLRADILYSALDAEWEDAA